MATSTDIKLLAKALRALGFSVNLQGRMLYFSKWGQNGTYNSTNGRLDVPESMDTASFKRAYAEQVVTNQAEEHGWEIEWNTNEAGNRETLVRKRSY